MEDPKIQKEEDLIEDAKAEKKLVPSKDYKKEKFIALFQARTILSKHGTMPERRMCSKELKRMKKQGIKAV